MFFWRANMIMIMKTWYQNTIKVKNTPPKKSQTKPVTSFPMNALKGWFPCFSIWQVEVPVQRAWVWWVGTKPTIGIPASSWSEDPSLAGLLWPLWGWVPAHFDMNHDEHRLFLTRTYHWEDPSWFPVAHSVQNQLLAALHPLELRNLELRLSTVVYSLRLVTIL